MAQMWIDQNISPPPVQVNTSNVTAATTTMAGHSPPPAMGRSRPDRLVGRSTPSARTTNVLPKVDDNECHGLRRNGQDRIFWQLPEEATLGLPPQATP